MSLSGAYSLRAMARAGFTRGGLVAWLGGQECVALVRAAAFDPCHSIPAGGHVVHSIIKSYCGRFEESDRYITVSIGFPASLLSDTADTSLARADSGMCAEKKLKKIVPLVHSMTLGYRRSRPKTSDSSQ